MGRQKSYVSDDVARRSMLQFWEHGYRGTSLDDLVEATGVSRHGLYQSFGDKRGLFAGAAQIYIDEVVTPAFSIVEHPAADLAAIERYFEVQLARAEEIGLPGPGCLLANSLTEMAPRDAAVAELVQAHLDRLEDGFDAALRRTGASASAAREYARVLTAFAQGLWSMSRLTPRIEDLRRPVATILSMIGGAIVLTAPSTGASRG